MDIKHGICEVEQESNISSADIPTNDIESTPGEIRVVEDPKRYYKAGTSQQKPNSAGNKKQTKPPAVAMRPNVIGPYFTNYSSMTQRVKQAEYVGRSYMALRR